MSRPRRPGYVLLAMLLDVLGILMTVELARRLRDVLPLGKDIPITFELPPIMVLLTAAIWFVVFARFNVYDSRRTQRLTHELEAVVTASLFALLVMAGALYFSFRDVSRLFVGYFFLFALITVVGWRVVARLLWHAVGGDPAQRPRRVLIVGAGALGEQAAAHLRLHHQHVIGGLDDGTSSNAELPILGTLADAATVVRAQRIDAVIVTLPYHAYERLEALIVALQKLPVQISVAPNYLNLVLHHATVEHISGMPLINLRDPALSESQRLVKRGFDLVIGVLMMVITLPIMALIALAVRLDTPGPAVFRQRRVGENGRLFTMYKFRTMIDGAEAHEAGNPMYNSDGHVIHKRKDDSRITRVGFFLRRTSLDELPQLINVLKGEMSLVGPRPELPQLVDRYASWQHKRFAIPQGMTGWWQINGRSDKPMHLHTEDDLYYIQHYSILLDVIIIWRTIFAVLRRRGAY
jgi:exopolysaccharide biosynthesis polyprenyl glycosylphosphotransferase